VHCLATVAEKSDGIVFTNILGIILSKQLNEDTDNVINVPDNQHTSYMEENTTNSNDENNVNTFMSSETESVGNNEDENENQLRVENKLSEEMKTKTI